MSEYIPIHQSPHVTEAYAAGHKAGLNPKTGHGMAAYFYGRPTDDDPDKEKIDQMNSAWLTGWFAGSREYMKENPDPRIVIIDEAKPLKGNTE